MKAPANLLPKDGEAFYYPAFFAPEESARLFSSLRSGIEWKHEPITLFGRRILQPRLTAWYGEGKEYSYSGVTMKPRAWTPALLEIKTRIEPVAGVTFTGALLNLYRDGKDSVSWHSDDEKELGPEPVIGSVSFGAAREFHFRHRAEKGLKASVLLEPGSFLLMRGTTQRFWRHAILKSSALLGERINITFRVLPG